MERRERMSVFIDEATDKMWYPPSVLSPKEATPTYAQEISDEERIKFNLAAGESPFGPPPEYIDILKEIANSDERYRLGTEYREVNVEQAKEFIRKRFSISHTPSIFFSSLGSYGILERIPGLFNPSGTRLFGLGPHFPSIDKFVKSYRNEGALKDNIRYAPIVAPLATDLSEVIEKTIQFRQKQAPGMKNLVFYICNPGTPKGDTAPLDQIEKLAKVCRDKRDLLIVDEAFGDFLSDSQSAIPLTEEYPIIVTRTLSKGLGMPGERIGYTVMHKYIGMLYKETNLLVFDMPAETQMLANRILSPEIVTPHLENVRRETTSNKREFVSRLAKNGIPILPTSMETPIITIDLLSTGSAEVLKREGINFAPGSGFAHTHPEMSNRYARLTIPKNPEDIPLIVDAISSVI